MNIKRAAFVVFIFISFLSCNKSGSSSSEQSYSGPVGCLAKKSANLTESIVGGAQVTNTGGATLTGSNTVALIITLSDKSQVLCSGAIVASNLILTAGHCFDNVNISNTSPGYVVFADSYGNPTTSNSAQISCWQRPSSYIPCSVTNSYNCVLNDITWVKINGNINQFPNYNVISILSNPQSISATEPKWMLGFGELNDKQANTSEHKYMVQSSSSVTYPDTLPSGAANEFDSLTFSNAYEQYLTVIGPNNQTNPGKGTCEGDSGGPVYVFRGGNYILAALTQGSNSLLSPHPTRTSPPYSFDNSSFASCNDGYGVYTTVGNYVSWITATSGVSLSTY